MRRTPYEDSNSPRNWPLWIFAVIGAGSAGFLRCYYRRRGRFPRRGADRCRHHRRHLVNVGCVPSKALIRAVERPASHALAAVDLIGMRPRPRDRTGGLQLRRNRRWSIELRRRRNTPIVLPRHENGRYVEVGEHSMMEGKLTVDGSLSQREKFIIATGSAACAGIPGMKES